MKRGRTAAVDADGNLTRRALRPEAAAFVYGVSEDFLAERPVDQLPRLRVSPKLTLYFVDDLERFFRRFYVTG